MSKISSKKKKNLILGMMLILFAGPLVVSWWLYNYTDIGRDGGAYNHGVLLLPPRHLNDYLLMGDSEETEKRLYGKWNLIYLVDNGCDQVCEQRLYMMRQIRLAMNNNSHRLQRVLFDISGHGRTLTAEQNENYKGQLIFDISVKTAQQLLEIFKFDMDPVAAGRLYLVDPLGNLMMSYSTEADPAGIINDLKRLLKYSRIG